jgi:CheY-like chemotaxis protein/HPt (histidine-containing phosphotransfer) domain-containing protein
MMGGTMWVESQVGRGSTFYFTVVARAVPGAESSELYYPQPQLAGKRVLVTDDNETNRQILTTQTNQWGMLTCAAQSGEQALDWLRQGESFDLAILDMHMPEMDGETLARTIRQLPGCQTLPLVMLTSLGKSEHDEASGDRLYSAFLTKPIKQSQLYDILIQVLGTEPIKIRPSSVRSSAIDPQMGHRLPLRILLAEDNLVNQQVALHLLQRLGYRADVASNGIEVLQALRRQSYDVVLMDVQMPEMDGLEAARHLTREGALAQRPRIVAMTANAMVGDRQMCLDAGMDDYISKPIRIEELVRALTQASEAQTSNLPDAVNSQVPALPQPPTVLDASMFQELREMMNRDEIVVEVIDRYLEESPKLLQLLTEAIARGEAAIVERTAHTLKSSSAILGATHLAQRCQELESMGQTNLTQTPDQLQQINTDYERVRVALRQKRQEIGGGE